ncbi:hypothetical protein ACFPRL_29505 [Pseudoclavibacter helvolus]
MRLQDLCSVSLVSQIRGRSVQSALRNVKNRESKTHRFASKRRGERPEPRCSVDFCWHRGCLLL